MKRVLYKHGSRRQFCLRGKRREVERLMAAERKLTLNRSLGWFCVLFHLRVAKMGPGVSPLAPKSSAREQNNHVLTLTRMTTWYFHSSPANASMAKWGVGFFGGADKNCENMTSVSELNLKSLGTCFAEESKLVCYPTLRVTNIIPPIQ